MRGIALSQKIFKAAVGFLAVCVSVGCLCGAAAAAEEVRAVRTETVSQTNTADVIAALRDAGIPVSGGEQSLRDALFLYQRTHGLCGTGYADLATRCALGLEDVSDGDTDGARDALRIALLCEAIGCFASAHPKDADLATLTAYAGVLLRRAASPYFPGGLAGVCAQGLCICGDTASPAGAGVHKGDTALYRRAAEDALYSGVTPAADALYMAHKDAYPDGKTVTFSSETLVFYR